MFTPQKQRCNCRSSPLGNQVSPSLFKRNSFSKLLQSISLHVFSIVLFQTVSKSHYWSPTRHVSHVACHMLCVTFDLSWRTCHVSQENYIILYFIFTYMYIHIYIFFGHSGETSEVQSVDIYSVWRTALITPCKWTFCSSITTIMDLVYISYTSSPAFCTGSLSKRARSPLWWAWRRPHLYSAHMNTTTPAQCTHEDDHIFSVMKTTTPAQCSLYTTAL